MHRYLPPFIICLTPWLQFPFMWWVSTSYHHAVCTSCETHAVMLLYNAHARLIHLNATESQMGANVRVVLWNLKNAEIPLQNLLILPGWNSCCQDNTAPHLSFLSSVVLPLLITLKCIIDYSLLLASYHSLHLSYGTRLYFGIKWQILYEYDIF